jgi:hypothetical protein
MNVMNSPTIFANLTLKNLLVHVLNDPTSPVLAVEDAISRYANNKQPIIIDPIIQTKIDNEPEPVIFITDSALKNIPAPITVLTIVAIIPQKEYPVSLFFLVFKSFLSFIDILSFLIIF